MPVLSAFLADRGDQLLDISVDAIVRSGGTQAIARALAEAGGRVEILGEAEAAEGIARLVVAEGIGERSDELAEEGAALSYDGFEEMVAGETIRQAAVEVAAEGLAEAGEGMEEIGSAGALADVADQLRN
jgi:hypothetical protein